MAMFYCGDKHMFKYICRDLMGCARFIPCGLIAGAFWLFLFIVRNRKERKGQITAPVVSRALFFTYLTMILVITFLSRESGSQKALDLELFSTFGINRRNDAYVVENVLLFIPYGIISPMAFKFFKNFFSCFLLGAVTSLGVELLQLVTGRGFFQIDDIMTNVVGMVMGFLIVTIARGVYKRKKKKEDLET